MPKKESLQEKLSRVRPPRVHIKYEVEIGGAIELKEIPFVVGVIGDFSGQPAEPLKHLRDRNFTFIDRDNFNDILGKMTPRLALRVANRLNRKDEKLNVELKFNRIEDFEPDQLAQQVPALKRLIEARNKLSGLLTKMDGNNQLESVLQSVLSDTEKRNQLGRDLGIEPPRTSQSQTGQRSELSEEEPAQ